MAAEPAQTMANGLISNGHTSPRKVVGAMAEYPTVAPPISERQRSRALSEIPQDYLLPTGYPDYLRLILTSRVYDVISESPISHAVNLSNRLECRVLLKREDLLPVFSFKLRGAYNKMAHLPKAKSWKGVICCSAGNHAQGVAYSARHLKIPATIVMPEGTPAIKHKNVSRMGGNVVLHGEDFDTAKEECIRREQEHGLTNIHPFDDPYIIAGQGTVGLELTRQASLQNLEAVFCCVGGGGLIAGIGVYIKRIVPHVKVIGVEAMDANAMAQSLNSGDQVTLSEVGLFADGAAVKAVGTETFRLCQDVVDDIILVSTDETCAAIKDVFEDTRSIVEPAGALALAGLKKYAAAHPSSNTKRELCAILSGANMNFDRLRFVAERANIGEQKEALLSVTIPERPGSFAQLVEAVLPQAVTEFSYRFASNSAAHVLIGVSVSSAQSRDAELTDLISRLHAEGMDAKDLSDNELAKSHIRYLCGGRSSVADERLYMFEFPERPGALFKFLRSLRPSQNISLFHYRNYGGDSGKILAGIQCPESEKDGLASFLKEIQYPHHEVSDSDVYKTFLRE
ncbi:MAG: hypothetical protein Q9227_007262 [Pyrenula ochraceoflavens]